MQTKTDLHIGNIICRHLAKEGRSKKWLADKVYCEYSNFCKTLKQPFIDIEMLIRISVALKYDFFADISHYIATVHKSKKW